VLRVLKVGAIDLHPEVADNQVGHMRPITYVLILLQRLLVTSLCHRLPNSSSDVITAVNFELV
jgi:hypothetical protein